MLYIAHSHVAWELYIAHSRASIAGGNGALDTSFVFPHWGRLRRTHSSSVQMLGRGRESFRLQEDCTDMLMGVHMWILMRPYCLCNSGSVCTRKLPRQVQIYELGDATLTVRDHASIKIYELIAPYMGFMDGISKLLTVS